MRYVICACLGIVIGLCGALPSARAASLVPLPPDHDADMRWFGADGDRLEGLAAFQRMPKADLTLWLAGNQFFAMERVIGDFQIAPRGISAGLITLPPGLLLEAIKAGGGTYDAHTPTVRPDAYSTGRPYPQPPTAPCPPYVPP